MKPARRQVNLPAEALPTVGLVTRIDRFARRFLSPKS
jgi:hypothetical protein